MMDYNVTATNGQGVSIKVALERRHKAYCKIVQGFVMVAAGIYELIYSERPPKPRDALRG